MEHSNFWEVVDEIGWVDSQDYKKINERLKKDYTKEELIDFKNTSELYRNALKGRLHSYGIFKRFDIGDDSLWDLTAHVVGLGKSFYDFIYESPEYIKHVAYKENFEYCFLTVEYECIPETV